jgi:hypothetical protein
MEEQKYEMRFLTMCRRSRSIPHVGTHSAQIEAPCSLPDGYSSIESTLFPKEALGTGKVVRSEDWRGERFNSHQRDDKDMHR